MLSFLSGVLVGWIAGSIGVATFFSLVSANRDRWRERPRPRAVPDELDGPARDA